MNHCKAGACRIEDQLRFSAHSELCWTGSHAIVALFRLRSLSLILCSVEIIAWLHVD